MKTKTPPLLSTILLVAALALAGCQAAPAPAPTATAQPSPTPAPPTATATTGPTAMPTANPLPTATPTVTPTPTVTSTPTPVPPTTTPTRVPTTPASIGEASYDQVITAPNLPTQTVKTYIKANKTRLEMTVQANQLIWIIDGDAKVAYMYLPKDKTAVKMSLEQFQTQQSTTSPNAQELAQSATRGTFVGSSTADGKPCDLYESKQPDVTTRTCVAQDTGFPLHAEVQTAQSTIKSDFKNVTLGNVPDDLFQLPADAQVVDFGGLSAVPTPPR